MKKLFVAFLLIFSVAIFAQKKIDNKVVDAGCGMCIFKDKNFDGCAMAIKIDGKAYPVEGVDKKYLGEMHGDNGYCTIKKKAQVSGEIKDGKFYATSFKLLEPKPKKS